MKILIEESVLRQALDYTERVCGNRCNAEYNPCEARDIAAALRTALDAAEKVEPVASAQFHQWAIEEHRKLSAAPITPDPNCTCDEHGACAYCWNGKKHDGYSDGMTAEDDKAFNRQWDVK